MGSQYSYLFTTSDLSTTEVPAFPVFSVVIFYASIALLIHAFNIRLVRFRVQSATEMYYVNAGKPVGSDTTPGRPG